MSAFVVVNPRAGGGRTGRDWPQIERALAAAYPNMRAVMTAGRGQASLLVRDALVEGRHEIIAVGDDGIINEAVNGMFDASGPIVPDAVLGFISSGTDGDFRKSFNIGAGCAAAIARLKEARPKPIDVGRVTCLSMDGVSMTRYFVNVASVGLSGEIAASRSHARIARLFGEDFAQAFHSALAMATYQGHMIRLRIDRSFDEIALISTLAVANGQFFGGGLRVAPQALPDDGQFDVVIMGGLSRRRRILDMKQLYSGTHTPSPATRIRRGATIMAAPVAETKGRPVLVEVDGESTGRLPATFEILPGAINLRC